MRRAARAHAHSAVHVTQVTTTRKIFTTVYSVFRNPDNSLLMAQWGGCGLVFVGMLLDIARPVTPAHDNRTSPAAPARPHPAPICARAGADTWTRDLSSSARRRSLERRPRSVMPGEGPSSEPLMRWAGCAPIPPCVPARARLAPARAAPARSSPLIPARATVRSSKNVRRGRCSAGPREEV